MQESGVRLTMRLPRLGPPGLPPGYLNAMHAESLRYFGLGQVSG